MNNLRVLAISLIVILSSCSKNEFDSDTPSINQLVGVWAINDFTQNGESIYLNRYSTGYIMINADSSYTAQFALDYVTQNLIGKISLKGKNILFDDFHRYTIVKLAPDTLRFTDNEVLNPIISTYTKVVSPLTTYQVQNKTTCPYKSYFYASESGSITNYGILANGEISKAKVITKSNSVRLRVQIRDTSYYTVYLQKLIQSQNNIVFIADTTKVKIDGINYPVASTNSATKSEIKTLKQVIESIK